MIKAFQELSMRLCFVDTSDYMNHPLGGQLTSVRNQLQYLQKDRDIEVVLVGIERKVTSILDSNIVSKPISQCPFVSVYSDESDPDKPVKSLRFAFAKGLLKNRKAIAALKADAFFIHCPEAFLPLHIMFPNKPIITFSHGSFFHIFDHVRFKNLQLPVMKILLNSYFQYVIRRSKGLFVLDTPSLIEYTNHNKNVWKVMNSIDINAYQHRVQTTGQIERAVFVGRLSANKRVDRIIRAVSELPNVNLDILGNGEEYNNLSDLVRQLQCDTRIKLCGKVEPTDMPGRLFTYDVLILNSEKEGMPMVILEAMAAGLAVITTNVGAIGELLDSGTHAIFTNGTVESIVEALKELNGEKGLMMKQMNAKKAIEFSLETVNNSIFKHIRELV